ncbi:MAG: hypothetical protein GWP05_02030 [Anaerolineaceae bacterium]|nr:hypothetical protein [Anaerolineaceae bacterium]
MLCDRIQDNLSAYIDGEAGPELAAEIDQHLRQCEHCQRLLDELRSVSAVLNSMPQHAAPSTLAEDLQIRLERQMLIESEGESSEMAPATDRRLARRRPSAWPRAAALAACLLLAIGITLLWYLPDRKETESADTLGELESSRVAAVDETIGTDKSAAGEQLRRSKKIGAFSHEAEEAKSLSSTGDNNRKTLARRDGGNALKFESGAATETSGGKTLSGKEIRLADREDNAPALGITAVAPPKPRGPEKGPTPKLRKGSSPAKAVVAGDNNLFLVTTDGAAAEKELDIVLEQAGIVEAKRWRETIKPDNVEWRYNYSSPTTQAPAAVEQLEVITVEANVNAEQFAALNLAVANNDILEVQDTSDGVFAATASTQRVMLQVPREVRLRELAGNRMIQSNLSQAAARRTRADRFQEDLSVSPLQRQSESAAKSDEKLALGKLEDAGRLGKVRLARGQEAEQGRDDDGRKLAAREAEELRESKDRDLHEYAAGKVEGDIENKKETETAETGWQPPGGQTVKKEQSEEAAEQVAPQEPPGRPGAEVAAESKPAKPPAGDEGKSAKTAEILAEKSPARQEKLAAGRQAEGKRSLRPSAPATKARPTQQQVAGGVRGLQTQRESGETLIPIMIQVVARRALPPEVTTDKSKAESAGQTRTGDRQRSTEPEPEAVPGP